MSDHVDASGSVLARIALAVVDHLRALGARVAVRTSAKVRVSKRRTGSVQAWIQRARIIDSLAAESRYNSVSRCSKNFKKQKSRFLLGSRVARFTLTSVRGGRARANAVETAWLSGAVIDNLSTIRSGVRWNTVAEEAVRRWNANAVDRAHV